MVRVDTWEWFVGVDWGQEEHALCVVNAQGQVCGRRRVAHTVAAIRRRCGVLLSSGAGLI